MKKIIYFLKKRKQTEVEVASTSPAPNNAPSTNKKKAIEGVSKIVQSSN
jgi:hypothetical protein